MIFGIKKRLTLSFILVILIPLVITVVSLVVTFSHLEQQFSADPDFNIVEEIHQINTEIAQTIENNYPAITDYGRFQQILRPFTSEYLVKIQVVNKEGILLFDSEDQRSSLKPANVELRELVKTARQNPSKASLFLYSLPIVVNGEEKALAFVWYNPSVAPFNVFTQSIKGFMYSFGAGILSLVLLIILFTWYLSRLIIRPLNELNTATERIAQGDLDFNIHYTNNDELGIFARSFESMRMQLKESIQKQKASENARKEMIASISHDLRTPISSIKGYVEGLSDGVAEDQETYQRYLKVIRDKTEQLNRQIEDLFEFSRLDAGQLHLKIQKVDSQAMLENILESLELDGQSQRPDLVIDRPLPSLPIHVDPQRIEQVIMNLLSNAFRYVGENGKVQVRAFGEEGFLTVAVADNGPGIAPGDIPRIFEVFYRGDKSRSRVSGGSGLGLAICKQIIEAHDGEIWVESREGEGSTFYFTIPLAK